MSHRCLPVLLGLLLLQLVNTDEDTESEIAEIVKRYGSMLAQEPGKNDAGESYSIGDIGKGILENLDSYKLLKIRIAVGGGRGSGKSNLINTMRDLLPQNAGAAKVGTFGSKTTIETYPHQHLPNFVFYELPGYGSKEFPKENYAKKIKLRSMSCVVICTQSEFSEADIWLAQEARNRNIPVFFVRTHIDFNLDNARHDIGEEEYDEDKTINSIRDCISSALNNHDQPDDDLFLISTRLHATDRWDFKDFTAHIIDKLPKVASDLFVMSLSPSFDNIIIAKKSVLSKRMNEVALFASLSNGVSGTDDILYDEINLYKEQMGLAEHTPLKQYILNIEMGILKTKPISGGASESLGMVLPPTVFGMKKIFSTAKSYKEYKQKLKTRLGKSIEEALTNVIEKDKLKRKIKQGILADGSAKVTNAGDNDAVIQEESEDVAEEDDDVTGEVADENEDVIGEVIDEGGDVTGEGDDVTGEGDDITGDSDDVTGEGGDFTEEFAEGDDVTDDNKDVRAEDELDGSRLHDEL